MQQLDFDSRDALTEQLAGEIIKRLAAAISDTGEAGLAVSAVARRWICLKL